MRHKTGVRTQVASEEETRPVMSAGVSATLGRAAQRGRTKDSLGWVRVHGHPWLKKSGTEWLRDGNHWFQMFPPPVFFFPELLASSKIAWVWIPPTLGWFTVKCRKDKEQTGRKKQAWLSSTRFFPSQIIKTLKFDFLMLKCFQFWIKLWKLRLSCKVFR